MEIWNLLYKMINSSDIHCHLPITLFTGTLELHEDTVEVVLSTAHHLLLTEVVEVCCDFLTKQLHPANCLGIQLFADTQGCSELHRLASKYTAVSL